MRQLRTIKHIKCKCGLVNIILKPIWLRKGQLECWCGEKLSNLGGKK